MSVERILPLAALGLAACVRMVNTVGVDADAAVDADGDGDGDADVDADVDDDGDGDGDGDGDVRDADAVGDADAYDPCGRCGDRLVRCDEQCDDGNSTPGDGCDACRFEPVGGSCGDHGIDPGEVCDDGNLVNGDQCNPTCNFTNRTTLFAGTPGAQGNVDGAGSSALLGGWGPLTVVDDVLYYGDSHGRTLRAIDIGTATVTTIAGDGVQRLVDAPVGPSASFYSLEAVASDGLTIWVADARAIRAVDASPPHGVATVAGDGVTVGCGDGSGPAVQSRDIRGLTYDGGYVWFLDAECATVRRLDPATNAVETVAGTPDVRGYADGTGSAALFMSPRYMATNHAGVLYIADTNGASIRVMDTETFAVTTFAGDGTVGYADGVGTSARIDRPRGMAVDGTSLYFTEFEEHTIRQGVLATQEVSTMIGTQGVAGYADGTGSAAILQAPFAIVYHFPTRSLFFMDSQNYVIRRIQ